MSPEEKQEEVVEEEPEEEQVDEPLVGEPVAEEDVDYVVRAFLVVDMVKGFLEKQTKGGPCALYMDGAKAVLIPNIKRELDKLTGDDLLIYLCDAHAEDDPEFKLHLKHCVEGTEESEVVDDLPVDEEESGIPTFRFNKSSFSGFRGTDLAAMLRFFEVGEIVIVGVTTEVCVFSTAQDAAANGYPTTIIRDCVLPLDKAKGDMALEWLAKNYGVKVV